MTEKYKKKVEEIIKETAESVGLSYKAVVGKSRMADIARCRHILSYGLYKYSVLTYREIGELLGNRDHATITNSIKVVSNAFDVGRGSYLYKYYKKYDSIIKQKLEEIEL